MRSTNSSTLTRCRQPRLGGSPCAIRTSFATSETVGACGLRRSSACASSWPNTSPPQTKPQQHDGRRHRGRNRDAARCPCGHPKYPTRRSTTRPRRRVECSGCASRRQRGVGWGRRIRNREARERRTFLFCLWSPTLLLHGLAMVMTDRSTRADVRNPILALPAAKALQSHPAREELAALLREIQVDARIRADKCWRTHKAPMAVYWKAVGVYAGHLARTLCRGRV